MRRTVHTLLVACAVARDLVATGVITCPDSYVDHVSLPMECAVDRGLDTLFAEHSALVASVYGTSLSGCCYHPGSLVCATKESLATLEAE